MGGHQDLGLPSKKEEPKRTLKRRESEEPTKRLHYVATAGFAYGILAIFLYVGLKYITSMPAGSVGFFIGWLWTLSSMAIIGMITTYEVLDRRDVLRPSKEMLLQYVKGEAVCALIVMTAVATPWLLEYFKVLPMGEDTSSTIALSVLILSMAVAFAFATVWDFWRYQKTPASPPPRNPRTMYDMM